jgi:hypothetical protein
MKYRLANVIVSVQGWRKIVHLKYGSVIISGEMVEEVRAVVADDKQVNGKERAR